MAVYNANIRLHDGQQNDYELLDKELQKNSFQRKHHKNKKSFDLPRPAASVNYSRAGNLLRDITNDIYLAAKKTGKEFSFTVIRNREQ